MGFSGPDKLVLLQITLFRRIVSCNHTGRFDSLRSSNNKEMTQMNTKQTMKKILSIITALFIGNFLFIIISLSFKTQLMALIPNPNIHSFVAQVITALLATVSVLMFHKTNIYKFNGKVLKEGFFTGLPLIITYTVLLLGSLTDLPGKQLIPAIEIVCVVLEWFLIGIAEESVFRGVVYELCSDIFGSSSRKGVYLTILVSSVIFGLCHLTNLMAPGISVKAVVVQVVSAMALGLLLAAIKYRSGGSIWPMVFIHALIDGSSFISGGMLWGGTQVSSINDLKLSSLLMIPIFIGIAVFIMRKEKTPELK